MNFLISKYKISTNQFNSFLNEEFLPNYYKYLLEFKNIYGIKNFESISPEKNLENNIFPHTFELNKEGYFLALSYCKWF